MQCARVWHMSIVLDSCHHVLPSQCPRQESSLVFDLRKVACKSPTLRGRTSAQRPAEELNPVLQFRRLPCCPAHPQGFAIKYPDQESNLDLELRRLRCDPLHHRDMNQGADDWTCTSIERCTGPLPFCSATSAQAAVQGVEPRGAVLETACLPASTLLWLPALRPGAGITTTSATQRSSRLH